MKYIRSLFLMSFAVSALCAAAFAQAPTARDERYRIGFQDVLDVQVFRHPELNVKVPVNPDGRIYLYRLDKPVVAVCKTERELADDIMAAYKVSYLRDPQVTVTVAEQRSQSMAVIGAVEKPGSFYISRQLNLLQLIAMAGGPSKDAGTRVLVVRVGSNTDCKTDDDSQEQPSLMTFKIRDLQEGKQNLEMRPGDVVSVLKSDIIYVYGNVKKPGPVEVREPITLTQAIASAEGYTNATDKDSVRILRQKPDSLEREEIVVNLAAIESQKAKDPYLQPNDIVAVSKDKAKAILSGIGEGIKNGIPLIFSRGIPGL
ncbi:MAG: SLBB domain-containing protein [Pyrinomonadaceae bacterium]